MNNQIRLITTADNPFDPFTQWYSWYDWDYSRMGYDTCGQLARLAPISDKLTDVENESLIDGAIDSLLHRGFVIGYGGQLGIYVPAYKGKTNALC